MGPVMREFKRILAKKRFGGGQVAVTQPPGGGGGGLDGANTQLGQIYSILNYEYGPGQKLPFVDTFTVGTSFSQLYTGAKPVSKALIQNDSSTDVMSVTASFGNTGAKSGTAGQAILLNPATSANQGGGSLPVGNIDLSNLYIATNTNSAQRFSIYGET